MKVRIERPKHKRKTFADLSYGDLFILESSLEDSVVSVYDVRMKVRRTTGAAEAVTLATGEVFTIAASSAIVISLDKAELIIQFEQ